MNALHRRCSLESRFARYASGRREVKASEFARLVHPAAGISWLTVLREDPRTAVAITHLLKTRTPGAFELAVLVGDPWQGQGLGTRLTARALEAAAADPGCLSVTAMFGAANGRALAIARRHGITIPAASAGVVEATLALSGRS
ncbi:GNAT family N-acetyltransferase [Streptacidiphilus sp. EB103A]|uniref:GNAT family N-acetyltransferase n=1 Tax=Streptacidiphilus sp. EB103A TaxID=3156275 RepID=UPI003518DA9A